MILRPDGTRVQLTYDPLGNLASTTDALGQVTQLDYVGTGQLGRVIYPDGQVFRFVYDTDERLVQILNPRLEKYEFEHNCADQIVAERTFDRRLLLYRYNKAARIVRIDYPEGEWREFSHDKLGNVLEDRGSDVQIKFVRDMLGRIEKAFCQDMTGEAVTEFVRDRFGRIIADVQDGRAVRYEHDEQGHRIARALPNGERTEYHYGADDHFYGLKHGGFQTSIGRDILGREQSLHAGDCKVESTYDDMGRLSSQKVTATVLDNPLKVLAERRYAYDPKGRLTSAENLRAGITSYHYDSIDQLISTNCAGISEVFRYDPAGSLTSILRGSGGASEHASWSLAPGGQVKAIGHTRYVNDGRGRRIQRIERAPDNDLLSHQPDGNGRVTTYGWDTKDRLREILLPDGKRVRFAYDAFGRRVRKDVLTHPVGLEASANVIVGKRDVPKRKTIEFLWDRDVLCEERCLFDRELAWTRTHVHEPGTFVPLLQIMQRELFVVINDHLGTPKELVNSAGILVWHVVHGAWGNVLDVSHEQNKEQFKVESPFRLLGQYEDGEVALCSTKFRYFEPDTGRWLSPDPLGILGGFKLFAFDGAPTMHSDPLGLCSDAGTEDLVGLRRIHILNRHKFGAAIPEKTEFPGEWSDNQIMGVASDVSSDPNSARGVGAHNSPFALGVRDGVIVRVDFYPPTKPDGSVHFNAGRISTAYPTNTPINP